MIYKYTNIIFSKERGTAESLLIIFGMVMVFMVLGNLLGIAITFLMVDFDLNQLNNFNEFLLKAKNGWWAMIANLGVSSFVTFIASGLMYWIMIEKKSWRDFNLSKLPNFSILFLIILSQLLFSPINSWFESVNKNMVLPESLKSLEVLIKSLEDSMKDLTEFLMSFTSIPQLFVAFFVIAVLAGIGEELIFRGLIQRKIYRATKNIHAAIWISAIIFSAIHFQFYGFLPRMFLGAMFGYFYYWTGNIWVPIICHIFNNGFAVIVMYLINMKKISSEYETMDHLSATTTIISMLLFSGIIYLIQKNIKTENLELQN